MPAVRFREVRTDYYATWTIIVAGVVLYAIMGATHH